MKSHEVWAWIHSYKFYVEEELKYEIGAEGYTEKGDDYKRSVFERLALERELLNKIGGCRDDEGVNQEIIPEALTGLFFFFF